MHSPAFIVLDMWREIQMLKVEKQGSPGERGSETSHIQEGLIQDFQQDTKVCM